MKTCSKCKTEKPFREFHKGSGKDGLRSNCKPCRVLEGHERYKRSARALEFAKNKQRANEAAKKGLRICARCDEVKPVDAFCKDLGRKDGLHTICKPCQQDSHRIHREKHPLRALEIARRCKYGITPEDFEQIRITQKNRCAICKDEFSTTPHVDHCHTTKKIRGVLCAKCNVGLGHFNDSSDRLRAAANYLDKANHLK